MVRSVKRMLVRSSESEPEPDYEVLIKFESEPNLVLGKKSNPKN